MSKHTPGPWFIFGDGQCVGGPHSNDAGTAGVAMCGMQLRPRHENRANAHLIAEAPELIRLLGLIVAEFKSDPMSVRCFDLECIVQPAIALVEKLKGQS